MLVRDLELILDAIDEELVEHVDAHGLLAFGTAERMLSYAKVLAAGHISFQRLDEAWEQWYPLVLGYVEAFECDELAEMMDLVPFGDEVRPGQSRMLMRRSYRA